MPLPDFLTLSIPCRYPRRGECKEMSGRHFERILCNCPTPAFGLTTEPLQSRVPLVEEAGSGGKRLYKQRQDPM